MGKRGRRAGRDDDVVRRHAAGAPSVTEPSCINGPAEVTRAPGEHGLEVAGIPAGR